MLIPILIGSANETSNRTSMSSMFGGKLFAGQRGFDPVTITMQIVSMQFTYYMTLSLCILILNFAVGYRTHMG